MEVDAQYFIQNEKHVNQFLRRCLSFFFLIGPAFALCNYMGLLEIPFQECAMVMLFVVGLVLLTRELDMMPRWTRITKYLLVIGIHLMICYISAKPGLNLSITYTLAPALSCLYYRQSFTVYSTEICYVILILTLYFRSYTEVISTTEYLSPLEWFGSFAFWTTLEFVALVVVNYLLVTIIQRTLIHLQRQNAAMEEMQNQLVTGFANLVESRDKDTGLHVWRTREYVRMIAETLKKQGNYVIELPDATIRKYAMAAPLHDMGKLAVPDEILHKAGKLTEQEYETIKMHTTEGYRLVRENLSHINDEELLRAIEDTVLYHHEHWDGSGYPTGLVGVNIPLCARIMAAADTLDALLSRRAYKSGMELDEAFEIMKKGRGSVFEPCIVDAVVSLRETLSDFLSKDDWILGGDQ